MKQLYEILADVIVVLKLKPEKTDTDDELDKLNKRVHKCILNALKKEFKKDYDNSIIDVAGGEWGDPV